mmetsp:Transcript_10034/g.15043  ORF Transcript_10034/g.15043 Transcript_10034/m.15043 type:complete len:217 (+) Transcript_10034:301-951(+)
MPIISPSRHLCRLRHSRISRLPIRRVVVTLISRDSGVPRPPSIRPPWSRIWRGWRPLFLIRRGWRPIILLCRSRRFRPITSSRPRRPSSSTPFRTITITWTISIAPTWTGCSIAIASACLAIASALTVLTASSIPTGCIRVDFVLYTVPLTNDIFPSIVVFINSSSVCAASSSRICWCSVGRRLGSWIRSRILFRLVVTNGSGVVWLRSIARLQST